MAETDGRFPAPPHDDGNDLSPELRDAVRRMRAGSFVRADWRALVAQSAVRVVPARPLGRSAHPARSWIVATPMLVAASLVLLLAGGAGGWLLSRRAGSTPPADARGVRTTRFALVAPGASRVAVVGDFNEWNPLRNPMQSLGDGRTWILDMPLVAGRHTYAFVVDGDLRADPAAPRASDDDFGVPNSMLLVSAQ